MSKHIIENFKYKIPENSKYNEIDNYEEEVHMTYKDEISWYDVSEDSEGDNETQNKRDIFNNRNKTSQKTTGK